MCTTHVLLESRAQCDKTRVLDVLASVISENETNILGSPTNLLRSLTLSNSNGRKCCLPVRVNVQTPRTRDGSQGNYQEKYPKRKRVSIDLRTFTPRPLTGEHSFGDGLTIPNRSGINYGPRFVPTARSPNDASACDDVELFCRLGTQRTLRYHSITRSQVANLVD